MQRWSNLAIVFALAGCFVDPAAPPPGVTIPCAGDGECPSGYVCPAEIERCVRADGERDPPEIVDVIAPSSRIGVDQLFASFGVDDASGLAAIPRARLEGPAGALPLEVTEVGSRFHVRLEPGLIPDEVELSLVVDAVDFVGNARVGEELSRFILDVTPPLLDGAAAKQLVALGEEVRVVVTGNERLLTSTLSASLVRTQSGEPETPVRQLEVVTSGHRTLKRFEIRFIVDGTLDDGTHEVEVTASDPFGNATVARVEDLEIDKSADTDVQLVSILYRRDDVQEGPLGAARTDTAIQVKLAVTGELNENCDDGEPLLRLGAALGAPDTSFSPIGGDTFELVVTPATPRGSPSLFVHVCDRAGNLVDFDLGASVLIYDDTPPVLTVDPAVTRHRDRAGFSGLAGPLVTPDLGPEPLPDAAFTLQPGRTLTRLHLRPAAGAPALASPLAESIRDRLGLPFDPAFVVVQAQDLSGALSEVVPVLDNRVRLRAQDLTVTAHLDTWPSVQQPEGAIVAQETFVFEGGGSGGEFQGGFQGGGQTGTGGIGEEPGDPGDPGEPGGNGGEEGTEEQGSGPAEITVRPRMIFQTMGPDGVIPDPGNCGRMVEDRRRGRLLYISPQIDIWAYDGFGWEQLDTPSGPPPRRCPAVAWSPRFDALVLFGGHLGPNMFNDTWLLLNNSWFLLNDSDCADPDLPSCRKHASMAWDPIAEEAVLFGGNDDVGRLDDTWRLSTFWREAVDLTPPPARAHHEVLYDDQRGQMLLIGGRTEVTDDAVYALNGDDWQVLATGAPGEGAARAALRRSTGEVLISYQGASDQAPTAVLTALNTLGEFRDLNVGPLDPRVRGALGIHSATDLLIQHGGVNRFDQLQISLAGPVAPSVVEAGFAQIPLGRRGAAIGYQPLHRRAVLHGGEEDTRTWIWNGLSWAPVNIPAPEPRVGAAIAPVGADLVLVGGTPTDGDTQEGDVVWRLQLDPLQWEEVPGLSLADLGVGPLADPVLTSTPAALPDISACEGLLYLEDGRLMRVEGDSWVDANPAQETLPRMTRAAVAGDAGRLLILGGDPPGPARLVEISLDPACNVTRVDEDSFVADNVPPLLADRALFVDPVTGHLVAFGGTSLPPAQEPLTTNWLELDLGLRQSWVAVPNEVKGSTAPAVFVERHSARWFFLGNKQHVRGARAPVGRSGAPAPRYAPHAADQYEAGVTLTVDLNDVGVNRNALVDVVPLFTCPSSAVLEEWAVGPEGGLGDWLPFGDADRFDVISGFFREEYALQCRRDPSSLDEGQLRILDPSLDVLYRSPG